MPRHDDDILTLADLIRAVVRESIPAATSDARVPMALSGTVEDLDEDLDVVSIRMDSEAMGSDPTLSDNYGEPGVIPTTRLGETFTDERARVVFEGPAGASSMRTGIESRIVLPFGAEEGRRIILDGNAGAIEFYDTAGDLVGLMDTDQWTAGDIENMGERVTIDPLSGFRLRDADNDLVAIIDQNGYTLRNSDTGQVSAEVKATGSFRLVDPNGTDDIEMVTTSLGNLDNPNYDIAPEASPGTTLTSPMASLFNTLPPDDLEIGYVVGWHSDAAQGSATMTPPAGWTEQADQSDESSFSGDTISMHSSVATNHPADAASEDFTSTESWEHAVGQRVVIRGGGSSSPSFRSVTTSTDVFSPVTGTATLDMSTPANVAAGDVLVVFVSVGTRGGFVPTSWVTPAGWQFMGADFSSSGSGASQSTVASGCWVKLATASEPATQSTTINLPEGFKMAQAVMVAIQDPFLSPGGVQIRMAGKPIRRQLAEQRLDTAGTELCDFTDIPPGYDNLEVIWDGAVDADGTGRPIRWQFNGDSGNNYYHKRVVDGNGLTQGLTVARVEMGNLGSTADSKATGAMNIYGYTSSGRPVVLGQAWWSDGLVLHTEASGGMWDASGAITRVRAFVAGSGAEFAAGTRVYLYGY